MTVGPRLVIQELTGSQRSIELAGWAGPRRGPTFGIEINSSKVMYPGNPRGTIQVLGPDWPDTQFSGRWSDRYLVNGKAVVQVVGFPDLNSSPWSQSDLVAAFYSLALASNALRVSWSHEVREGILKRFIPTYGVPTGDDCEWELEFEWQASDVAPASTVAAPVQQDQRSQMRQEMGRTDRAATRRPRSVGPNIGEIVAVAQLATRQTAGVCFDAFRQLARSAASGISASSAASGPTSLTPSTSAIVTATGDLLTAIETEFSEVVDVPVDSLTLQDGLIDRLASTAWRLDLWAAQAELQRGSITRARLAAKQATPGQLLLVTGGAGESLRRIAYRVYGSADSWQLIADANNLSESLLPRRMLLVIPQVT